LLLGWMTTAVQMQQLQPHQGTKQHQKGVQATPFSTQTMMSLIAHPQ
jgi:hypothetical protein